MTKLFSDFDTVSAKQWKQKIQVDLKGADYNSTLVWSSQEGINIKPFYHKDEQPGPLASINVQASQFKICQSIYVNDAAKSNTNIIHALNEGVESLYLIMPSEDIDFKILFENIDLSATQIYFSFQFIPIDCLDRIKSLSNTSNISLNIDLIGNLSRTGNWFDNLKADHLKLESAIDRASGFKSALSVDMALYQNAGANIIQQLAYGLAHANEYLNHFKEKMTQPLTFNVSVGTNYFFEIAKLRALRLLWRSLASEYDANQNCEIFVTPTKRNKTLYDYNTNMLRTTTECMSAILGGADTICNLPYDAIYHKDNDFGERISKNQLLILKHESYFDAVDNPSDGTYYIESLTMEMAEKALILFKEIEANGGFLKLLKEGTIQRKTKESANKEQQLFNEGKVVLLGTNKHPNPNDQMKNELELYPFLKTDKRKTLIEPILPKRLAEVMEQERLKTE